MKAGPCGSSGPQVPGPQSPGPLFIPTRNKHQEGTLCVVVAHSCINLYLHSQHDRVGIHKWLCTEDFRLLAKTKSKMQSHVYLDEF